MATVGQPPHGPLRLTRSRSSSRVTIRRSRSSPASRLAARIASSSSTQRPARCVRTDAYADKPFLNRLHSGEAFGDGGLVVAMFWALVAHRADRDRADHLLQDDAACPPRHSEGLLVRRRPAFLAALACATLVRLLALAASRHGRRAHLEDLGLRRLLPRDPRLRRRRNSAGPRRAAAGITVDTTVDYPPAAMYELALVGLAYRAIAPTFPRRSAAERDGEDPRTSRRRSC